MFTKCFKKIMSCYNTIVHDIYLLYPHWCNTLEDYNF